MSRTSSSIKSTIPIKRIKVRVMNSIIQPTFSPYPPLNHEPQNTHVLLKTPKATSISKPISPSKTPVPVPLDPISEWRAWQTLTIIYTIQLNHQIERRWHLEQQCMQDRLITKQFPPIIFLQPVPALRKPNPNPKTTTNNPFNTTTMNKLRARAAHLRARVEKAKEIVSEIERRIALSPPIRFPTHFCHSCVEDGERVEVLLTKCGHRVCRTCLKYGVDENGVYECSICFAPAEFVAWSPLGLVKACSGQVSTILKGGGGWDEDGGDGEGEWEWSEVLFADC